MSYRNHLARVWDEPAFQTIASLQEGLSRPVSAVALTRQGAPAGPGWEPVTTLLQETVLWRNDPTLCPRWP